MTRDPMVITTATTVVAGVACQAIARRLRIPSIVPLLAGGIALGPEGLDVVRPQSLGGGLQVLVGFAVAIILFEGGLSLKTDAFRHAGRSIRRLVTLGALLTWALCALAAWLVIPGLDVGLATLFGSLVIVTGPTVIAPLLNSVRPRQRIADVLRGESILIDPVGAFCAVLTLEFILEPPGEGVGTALLAFGQRVGLGTGLGIAGAWILDRIIRRQQYTAPEMRNLTVLAGAIGLYAVSDSILGESGVLTVTLAGFLLGWKHPPGVEEIEEFKGHITVLMVSMVFILLAANLSIADTMALGWPGVALVALIIAVVRPIVVFASTHGGRLSLREKLFISWISPRGIVAAAVSSLFALILQSRGIAGGNTVLSLTFATIAGTVVLQGLTARSIGAWLGVLQGTPTGFLLVGANPVGRKLALALQEAGNQVLLVDTNPYRVRVATEMGLTARRANVLDEVAMEGIELSAMGYLIAVTPNDSVNRLATRLYARDFGEANCLAVRLENSPEPTAHAPDYLFGRRLTYEDLERRLARNYTLETNRVDDKLDSKSLPDLVPGAVPLLALQDGGVPHFLPDEGSPLAIGENLLYLAAPATE